MKISCHRAGVCLQDEIRSHEAAGFPHRLNLVTSCDEVADGRQGGTGLRRGQDDRAAFYPPDGTDTADFADGGRGENRPHACGGTVLLKKDEQENLFATMESKSEHPSLSQAQRMKQLSQSGRLDMDTIFAIMTEEKGNQKETLKINTSKLKKYFPKNTTPKQMEETITRLLNVSCRENGAGDSR